MARRKKHKPEEEENLERWLVSYADFITLLFAFFVVMYALSQTDKLRYQEAILSIQRAFLSGGGIFPLRGFPFTPFEKPPDRGSHIPPAHQEIGKYSKTNEGHLPVDRMTKKLHGLYEKNTGMSLKSGAIEVIPSAEGFKIRLGESVLFKAGSNKIKPRHVPFLYELGTRLQEIGHNIQVEGHTDNSQPANESNWQLSLSRASNVVKFLVQATDFPKNKVSLAGYGDTEPITTNETEEGRMRNRRVEIVVMTKGKPITEVPW